ncbi:CaiB/BaiF CoA transferase family protein [Pseudonocardia acidicola]|uniref:CoA transferase n=1 Tax=Pseudonocardia acidicola TaxID=2724939 RepID=A0ABX1SIC2_9PSEU|nr:CoA transferase [Pseudonocardia acidicola]NMI01301.1 CoA transferase [Pseudonocardia acidicola]
MNGPLQGIRVIDLATVVMGPYAAQILGDLGADVIKVEPPTGDRTRRIHPQRHETMSALAMTVNRNKRSLAVDLKTDEGRAALLALVKTADVVITNMRPGALRRLGLDHDALAAVNPRLIYCTAQGFRSDSALADRAAYDEIIQASSGLTDLMRRATGDPAYVPTILADKVCALTIVYSVLAAVVHQQRTGEGQHIEVPMADTMLAFNLVEHLNGLTFDPPEGPVGFPRSMSAGHRAVRTADGWACILPYDERNIRDFFTFAGRPELGDDPRFATPAARAAHHGDLYELIAELAATHTTAEWEELCAAHSIPMAPVLDLDDAPTDPYVTEGGVLSTAEHPTEGRYRVIGIPVRFSATPGAIRRHAPNVGEHNDELLAELAQPAAEETS